MEDSHEILVNTRPSKAVVVDSLTRDISVEACVFDLVDNSIDAARNTLVKLGGEADIKALPESYEKFWIKVIVSGDSFSIEDNCGGIMVEHLQRSVLRFGERSAHKMGIGVFGVGLNRALFRIGRLTDLASDTGTERCILEFDTQAYLESNDWEVKALKTQSIGKIGTKIKISSFTNETSQLFGDSDWVKALGDEAGRRYGKFIDKGLQLFINGEEVLSKLVRIRPDGPYGSDSKFFKVSDDISVYIQSGQHLHHRFSAEKDYDKARNTKLTSDYGWNIFCNERAVLISDRTRKTGWMARFHTEFYGFVGHVSFVCEDPSKLPWNTTKSDVDLNNSAYNAALDDMAKFAAKWRANAGDAKQKKILDEELLPTPKAKDKPVAILPKVEKKSDLKGKAPASNPKQIDVVKKPVVKIDHNRSVTVLPSDINQHNCYDKLLALVHEAQSLDLGEFTYSGLVLIRVLFEASAICFLTRKGLYVELKATIICNRNAEKLKAGKPKLSAKEEKNSEPSIDEIISFLQSRDDVWDDVSRNKIKFSLGKFSGYKATLNSAAHNTFQMLNKYEAFNVRDAVLPILRHLIEK